MLKRFLDWGKQRIATLSQQNGGNWAWLDTKFLPLAALNRVLWRGADPSLSYYVLLLLSVVIATLGLLANSSATIIGAMIVAPLMGPIVGIAFAMVMANRRLLSRASVALFSGIFLAIATSALVCRMIGIETLTSEIQARISPTLIDLWVALAAGAAGAYATSNRQIANALPGVAIAVALVPPLSVVGIGIALLSQSVAFGALLLFLTNLVGIIFSSALVFLMERYGSIARAKRGLFLGIAALLMIGIPLGFSFQNLLLQERIRQEISQILRKETLTFSDRDIRYLRVQRRRTELLVQLEVASPVDSITERQVELVRNFLQKSLGKPTILDVTIIPIERFTSPTNTSEEIPAKIH